MLLLKHVKHVQVTLMFAIHIAPHTKFKQPGLHCESSKSFNQLHTTLYDVSFVNVLLH